MRHSAHSRLVPIALSATLVLPSGDFLEQPAAGATGAAGASSARAAEPQYITMVAARRTPRKLIVRQRTATGSLVDLDAHQWSLSTDGDPKREYLIFNKVFAERTTLQKIIGGGLLTVRSKGKQLTRSADRDVSRVVMPTRCLGDPRVISVRATTYVEIDQGVGEPVYDRETYPRGGYYAKLRPGDAVLIHPGQH